MDQVAPQTQIDSLIVVGTYQIKSCFLEQAHIYKTRFQKNKKKKKFTIPKREKRRKKIESFKKNKLGVWNDIRELSLFIEKVHN